MSNLFSIRFVLRKPEDVIERKHFLWYYDAMPLTYLTFDVSHLKKIISCGLKCDLCGLKMQSRVTFLIALFLLLLKGQEVGRICIISIYSTLVGEIAMPGPTAKNNPWAEELKKSHRRRSHKGLSGKDEKEAAEMTAGQEIAAKKPDKILNLSETKDDTSNLEEKDEKASLDTKDDEISYKKCVKDQVKSSSSSKVRPPKVKPPSLPVDEDSRSLYQDARSQLRPVARILSRQLSQEVFSAGQAEDQEANENPVDKLIRQGSMTGIKGRLLDSSLGL